MSWCSRSSALLVVTGGFALSILITLSGGLPAFAGGAGSNAVAAANASWRMFAADLASASGYAVRYEAPTHGMASDGEPVPTWASDLGGVGVLRIGAVDGPCVAVLPENFMGSDGIAAAYANAGLKEPRRFAQELVGDAISGSLDQGAHGSTEPGMDERSLSALLREASILIPVFLQHGSREARDGLSSMGSPRRNFPVRWEAAAAAAPRAAGPYPASHPSVRALTTWLHRATDCAGVVVVGGEASQRKAGARFPSGTLKAYCDEVLQIDVRPASQQQCMEAIQGALGSAPRLSFADPQWTRLGTTNWSLEVTVERHSHGKCQSNTVLLHAAPLGGEVRLTAAAASTGKEALELLPLRNEGVLLKGMAGQAPRRVRMFFTQVASPEGPRDGLPQTSGGSDLPLIALTASAPRALKALLHSQSGV